MPKWLQVIAAINPLSYIVDALRVLLLPGYQSNFTIDILVIILATVILVSLAGWSFKRIIS
jgi:ABC-2 type transport system permease protein